MRDRSRENAAARAPSADRNIHALIWDILGHNLAALVRDGLADRCSPDTPSFEPRDRYSHRIAGLSVGPVDTINGNVVECNLKKFHVVRPSIGSRQMSTRNLVATAWRHNR